MRTLEQIRQQNKQKNMFFDGMEEKPVQLPPEAIKEIKDFYRDFIKPTIERVFSRQENNGYLDDKK